MIDWIIENQILVGAGATILAALIGLLVAILSRRSSAGRGNHTRVQTHDDSQSIHAGSGSQNIQVGGDATIIQNDGAIGTASPQKPLDASLSIELKAKGPRGGEHTYDLQVTVENRSNETFEKWRVEIQIPRALLAEKTTYVPEVRERRTDSLTFFRIPQKPIDMPRIYPGDRHTALRITLAYENPISISDPVASESIRSTLFIDDRLAAEQVSEVGELLG